MNTGVDFKLKKLTVSLVFGEQLNSKYEEENHHFPSIAKLTQVNDTEN